VITQIPDAQPDDSDATALERTALLLLLRAAVSDPAPTD
jgi:hypothetical protein